MSVHNEKARGHGFALGACGIIAALTALHFYFNVASYAGPLAFLLIAFYASTIGLLCAVATSATRAELAARLGMCGAIMLAKVLCVAIFIMDFTVPVWDFTPASTAVARSSLPLYHLMNDVAALLFVLMGVGIDRLKAPAATASSRYEP